MTLHTNPCIIIITYERTNLIDRHQIRHTFLTYTRLPRAWNQIMNKRNIYYKNSIEDWGTYLWANATHLTGKTSTHIVSVSECGWMPNKIRGHKIFFLLSCTRLHQVSFRKCHVVDLTLWYLITFKTEVFIVNNKH